MSAVWQVRYYSISKQITCNQRVLDALEILVGFYSVQDGHELHPHITALQNVCFSHTYLLNLL